MGYVYSAQSDGTTPYIPFKIGSQTPLDERSVIDTRANLINPATWGPFIPFNNKYKNYTYDGIIVSVVYDTTPENNGVYMLKDRNKHTKFADVEPTDPLYDPDGWRKIDGNGTTPGPSQVDVDQYTIKEGTEEYLPADEQVPGLHVVRIDGGNFQ